MSVPPNAPHAFGRRPQVPPAGLAVLVVDDEPTSRTLFADMLRRVGAEVDLVRDGHEAVRYAHARDYDVVVMDLQMPSMSGVEAMKAIRALRPPERCPKIIAVSGQAVDRTPDQMTAAGFDAFYAKPVSFDDLRALVAPPAPTAPLVARPMTPTRHAADADAARSLLERVNRHVVALVGEEDPEFVADLVETFAETTREAVDAARAARSAGDAGAVAAAAHTIRGSASNVGLETLADAWAAVEGEVVAGGAAAFGPSLEAVLVETAQTAEMLATASGTPGGGAA